MKCPYCGSKNTQGTNIGERAFARAVSFGAGLLGMAGGPNMARGTMVSVNKAVCEYREYICLDCKQTFREKRTM